jgi:hypothetical protein
LTAKTRSQSTTVAREDSQFLVHLIATAALGDAIYGT